MLRFYFISPISKSAAIKQILNFDHFLTKRRLLEPFVAYLKQSFAIDKKTAFIWIKMQETRDELENGFKEIDATP